MCFPLRELEVFCRLPVLIVFSARSLASVPSNGVSSSDMGLGREGGGGAQRRYRLQNSIFQNSAFGKIVQLFLSLQRQYL